MENETYYKENFAGESLDGSPQTNPVNNQETENNISQSLLGPREILNESWSLYKARFKTLLGVSLIPSLILILLLVLFGLIGFFSIGLGSNIINYSLMIIFAILMIAIVIFQFWGRVALIYAIKDSRENIGIKESFHRGRGKIYQVFIVSLLSGLITMGGFLLFGIPGIIFSVWFTFAMFVIVEEDLKGMNVLLKCREYVRDYWWKILWRNLYIGGIMLGIAIFFMVIELIFTYLHLEALRSLVNLVDVIVMIILTPFATIYQFLLFKNIKAIKGDFAFTPSKKAKIAFLLISIIGFLLPIFILFSIVFVSLDGAKGKAYDAERKFEIRSLRNTLEFYYDENNYTYPTSLDQLVPKYTNNIPADPETELPYSYRQINNGKGFELCAQLETGEKDCVSEDGLYGGYSNSFEKSFENTYDQNKSNADKTITNNSTNQNDLKRKVDLIQISAVLKSYYQSSEKKYPISPSMARLNEDNEVARTIKPIFSFSSLKTIPSDPMPGNYYGYTSVDGKSFELTAQLENLNDPNCDQDLKIKKNICIYKLKSSL